MKSALKRIFGDNLPQRGAGELRVSGDAADSAYYTRFTGKKESRSSLQNQTAVQGTNPIDRYGRRTRCAVCAVVLKDKPSALEGTSMSTWIAQHITALHATRKAFTEAECADCHEDDILIVNDDAFMPAKHAELCNWKRNDVFEEVKDEGQKCISMRWVCPLKESPDGVVPKARLVARDFEEMNTMKLPKDSPTCASESLKMIMAVIVC